MTSNETNYAFIYPPDLDKCMNHRKSMRIFKGLEKDQTNLECQCCQRRVGCEEDTGECCYSKMQLSFLGPGLPLYFTFIKNSIILLLVLSIVFCVFALYSNIVSGYCEPNDKCSNNVFDTLAIINKIQADNYLSIQNYMLLAFVVISFFILQCFRYNFRSIEDDCDDIIDSPSDYAMILRRLPSDTTTADIEEMIEERRGFLQPHEVEKTQNLRVISIIMSFKMGEYNEVKMKNIEEFEKCIDQDRVNQFSPESLPTLVIPANIAVVVFARQQSKEMFKYRPNICQKTLQCIWTPCIPRSDYRVRGEKVAIERAPEPDDIVWANAGISMCGAITRKTIYGFLSILVLILGGAAQWGLAVAEQLYAETDTEVLLMSTAASILVSILNVIIQQFLIFTSIKERNETQTEFNTVLMIKISMFQFLNTGVFVVVANFLADIDGFTLDQGLVFEVTQVMILNAVTPNLSLFLLNYCELIQRIKRYCIEKGSMKKSQLEANKIYEGPTAQIAYKYAYIFKTIWLTAFYAPLAPVVVPISIVGLIVNYFLEKCIYGKVYCMPNMLSSILNDSAIELLEYFPFILSIGEFSIYLYLKSFHIEKIPQYWSIPIYVSLCLSFINLMLPMDELNHKLCKLPFDNMVYPDYEKVQNKFQVTYQMTNPAYECKRKRTRDKFIMNKLFGHIQNIEMTNLGLLGSPNGNQPLMQNQNLFVQNQENSQYQENMQYQENSQNPNLAAMGLAGMGMHRQNKMTNPYYSGKYNDIQQKKEQKLNQSVYKSVNVSQSQRYSSAKAVKDALKLRDSKYDKSQ